MSTFELKPITVYFGTISDGIPDDQRKKNETDAIVIGHWAAHRAFGLFDPEEFSEQPWTVSHHLLGRNISWFGDVLDALRIAAIMEADCPSDDLEVIKQRGAAAKRRALKALEELAGG